MLYVCMMAWCQAAVGSSGEKRQQRGCGRGIIRPLAWRARAGIDPVFTMARKQRQAPWQGEAGRHEFSVRLCSAQAGAPCLQVWPGASYELSPVHPRHAASAAALPAASHLPAHSPPGCRQKTQSGCRRSRGCAGVCWRPGQPAARAAGCGSAAAPAAQCSSWGGRQGRERGEGVCAVGAGRQRQRTQQAYRS